MVTTFTFSNLGGHVPGLELLGAQGVADVFDGVAQTVGEVVGGVDAPGLARVRVRRVLDAVGHRVLLAVLHDVLHTQSSLGNGIWEWNIGMEYGEWNMGMGHGNGMSIIIFRCTCRYVSPLPPQTFPSSCPVVHECT